MSESDLLVGFITFAFLIMIVAVFLRKQSVRDIFDDIPLSSKAVPSAMPEKSPFSTKGNTSLGGKQAFSLNRKTINTIGKILVAIGAIMLFAPLPASLNNISLGIAFLGYLMVKATAPPKKKNDPANQNPTAQKIRQLANKPEYQEALKILFSDLKNTALATEEEKYQRSILYLQKKGIPPAEAKENLLLLTTLLNRQKS